jgi:uncharacterized lipoprotein
VKRISFIVCLIFLSAGCSTYSSNGETLYLGSYNGSTLEVPPPLTKANISSFYDLPPQNQDPRVSIAPPIN